MRLAIWFGTCGVAALALAGVAVAQGPDLPAGAGKDLVEGACTACHAITQVTSQHRTKESWGDIVDQMISRGAQVSDADYPVVVDYLAKNFAAGPAAGAAPAAAAPAAGGATTGAKP